MNSNFLIKNWRVIPLLLCVVLFFIFLSNTYKIDPKLEVVVSEQKTDVPEIDDKAAVDNEGKERDQKIAIINEVFGDHHIKFAGQNLKLKGFFNPEDDVMSTIYSSDILSYQSDHEIAIYQYKNKISAAELLDKELLYQAKNSYNTKYLKTEEYEDNYFIILSDVNNGSSFAVLSLIKIFEKDNRTYKISYQKTINDDVLNVARYWTDEGYKELVNEFGDIDAFSGIDLSYAQKIFDDSLKIKENLSKSNVYKDIKWATKTIKENNVHADINLEYPEFKGFYSANNLNKIITDIVLGTLDEDRKIIEDWINGNTPEKSDFDLCKIGLDYDYECSVNLHSSFKVKSIVNDVISIEIVLTDYTGGGNGNHSYVKTVIYDLKNGKQLFIDDMFCGGDYLKRVKSVLKAKLISGLVFDNSLEYLTDEALLSDLRETSFHDFGLILSFNPYIFTPGIVGVYDIFIPYTLLGDNLCFKDVGNNEIFIRRNLLNLDIPAKLSDSCGFVKDNCDDFYFYEGKFNEVDSYGFTSDEASISVLFNDYKTGDLLDGNKKESIVIVPYFWQLTSESYGLYVLRIENNNLIPIVRIDGGKNKPENLRIENNKIYFTNTSADQATSRECYFKNNKLEEKELICK